MKTLSLENLAAVIGGVCTNCMKQRSHADELKRGNGGIVPRLPPLSHAEELRRGNGGIVPKL